VSSDNGLYILVTEVPEFSSMRGDGKEYRVAYHMAVENYQWDDNKKDYSNDPDTLIKNAREMWKDAKVLHTRKEALLEADRQYQEFMKDDFAILEYGISFIEIPRSF